MKKTMVSIVTALSLFTAFSTWADDAPSVSAATAAANTAANTPTASAVAVSIKLSQRHGKLYAYVTLTQSQATASKVNLSWIAPANSGCNNSDYSLNYNYKKFHTRAFRTVAQVDAKGNRHVCAGTWQARILDSNNQVLGQASIEVKSSPRQASRVGDNAATVANSSNAAETQTTPAAQQEPQSAQPAAQDNANS